MKKYIFIMLLSLTMTSIQAQYTGLSVTGGIGSYDLRELKDYQDDLIARMPVEVKGLSYYPPYTNFRVSLFKQTFEGVKYGLIYSYSSSGAHANYTDNYAGYLNLDHVLSAYQLGVSASYRLLYFNFFEVMAYGDLRLSYIKNKVSMNVSTPFYYESNSLSLRAVSPFAEGGIEALFHLKKTSIGIEGGYLYDVGIPFYPGKETGIEPSVSLLPDNDIRSQMSGFRIGLKIVFWFNKDLIE